MSVAKLNGWSNDASVPANVTANGGSLDTAGGDLATSGGAVRLGGGMLDTGNGGEVRAATLSGRGGNDLALGSSVDAGGNDVAGVGTFSAGTAYLTSDLVLTGLPTADPHNQGQVWNDAGTLKVSAG